jgi:hypothetical protein
VTGRAFLAALLLTVIAAGLALAFTVGLLHR